MLINKVDIDLELDEDVIEHLTELAAENKVSIDEVIEHILRAEIARIQAEETQELRDCIGNLLNMLDDLLGPTMHQYGQSPDWFVYSAALACNACCTNSTPTVWPTMGPVPAAEVKVTFSEDD